MAEDEEKPPRAAGNGVHPATMFRWGVYVSLGVLAVLAAAAAVYTTRAVLVRVLIALFVAISLDPAVRMLTRRGMRRGLAVLVIFLMAGGLVAAFLVSVIPAMVHQFESLVHDFPGYIASLQDRSARFRELTDRFQLTSKIQDLLAGLPGRLGGGLLGFTRRLFGALFSTLTVVVLTIYFMADVPLGARRRLAEVADEAADHRLLPFGLIAACPHAGLKALEEAHQDTGAARRRRIVECHLHRSGVRGGLPVEPGVTPEGFGVDGVRLDDRAPASAG